MITKLRAVVWAFSFGIFFHMSMNEKHSIFASMGLGVLYTGIVDILIGGATRDDFDS